MDKTCATCVYEKGKKCRVMKEKQDNCPAWADEQEARKRETDIKKYRQGGEDIEINDSVRKLLDKNFSRLYAWGMNDRQIAERLGISTNSAGIYRRNLSLPANRKRRSAGTVAAQSQKAL